MIYERYIYIYIIHTINSYFLHINNIFVISIFLISMLLYFFIFCYDYIYIYIYI